MSVPAPNILSPVKFFDEEAPKGDAKMGTGVTERNDGRIVKIFDNCGTAVRVALVM